MQIACPQCSSQYDLDPRLLPPSGASVQCTRCSQVFTATPSGEVRVAGPVQSPARSSVGTKTGVFGSPMQGASRQGPPNTQTTQIFGVVPPSTPAPDEAPTPPAGTPIPGTHLQPGGKTQVFGAPGAPAASPSTTQVFGAAAVAAKARGTGTGAASQSSPATTTQVFGALPQPSPLTTTQVFGAPTPPPESSPATTTQVFGAPPPPQSSPATTTQVFGAPPPPQSSPATTTQVFGAPAVAAKAPPATTTQVFGAASVPPPPPPSASTTQVFGAGAVAAKAPPATTTQVFGAASVPGPSPTSATTQTFGSTEVQAARKAMETAAPAPGADSHSAPWLAEPAPSPMPPRSVTRERHPTGPQAAPPVELPEEPVGLPGPALPSLPQETELERSGPIAASRRAPALELPPELIVPERPGSARSASEPSSGGGRERLFIILAAVVALGLTAWLSYPVWRNQGAELPGDAVSAKESAASLLRRDDAASREQAIRELTSLVGRYPKYTEAQAELVVALALHLDDLKVELEWVHQEEARLRKEISQLELAKATVDWPSRVNARRQELATQGEQKRSLEAAATDLTKRLDQSLAVIRLAPETEPAADVVARVKAQAISEAVNGTPQAVALAERLKKVEARPHWSVLALAEYGLNAGTPPSALATVSEQLAQVRERDPTFLRAYVLGARLALRQKDPSAAQALLEAVLAFNPNHALARKLQKWAADTAPTP
ncbi:zinc-ribbon domain-containing protein [Hyalangium gracile]|uniref:zinc-ribbon domain-containing protein n=1 Tax=Hyalangium gracile TaxID=394092 RepID=UPI001CCD30AC|nr:zinc-ribbon domain-containing protein [Hyalangium gracile]